MPIIPSNWLTIKKIHQSDKIDSIVGKPSHTFPRCLVCNNPQAKQDKCTVRGIPGRWVCASCDWHYAEIMEAEE